MLKQRQTVSAVAAVALMSVTLIASAPDAQARGWGRSGPRGAAGGYTHSGAFSQHAGIGGVAYGRGAAGARGGRFAGPNGGTFSHGRAGIVGQNAGLVGGGFTGTGPRGASGSGAGVAGWRKGVGGFEQTNMNLKGAGGSTYTGSTRGKYNAQTGVGEYDSSRQVYDAKNGNNYGYNQTTEFTKGQGASTSLDTVNHGDYSIDWQKGEKPVVTPAPTAQ